MLKEIKMESFKVNDRIFLPRVLNGIWAEVNARGTVTTVKNGYTVLFDNGTTISGLTDRELAFLDNNDYGLNSELME